MYFKKKSLILLVLLFIFSCQNEVEIKEPVTTPTIEETEEIKSTHLEGITLIKTIFLGKKAEAMLSIKQAFDTGLANGKPIEDYAKLYKNHAHRMRADYFNKFPYTLNFPFNDKFDLRQEVEATKELSFLTNKCGFQNGDTGEIIHYLCLDSESNYMTFLEQLGERNPLIQSIAEDYKKKKSITAEAKYNMLINSYEKLDFEQVDHQIFYAFFQILVNEERLAAEKVKVNN